MNLHGAAVGLDGSTRKHLNGEFRQHAAAAGLAHSLPQVGAAQQVLESLSEWVNGS